MESQYIDCIIFANGIALVVDSEEKNNKMLLSSHISFRN